MTIRIVHLIPTLQVGGAEHMLEKLVTGMDDKAFTTAVVTLTGEGPIGRRLRAAGIPIYALGMTGPATLPRTLFRLYRLLRQLQPHVLQTWLYHADLVGSIARFMVPKTPLLWNLRCSDMNMAHYSRNTRLVLRLLGPLSRLPDCIVTNSEAGRDHHIGLGYRSSGWQTIPNGFDLTKFSPANRGALRSELRLMPNEKIVGMVARFDPMKDHANFLAMVRLLAARDPNLHFALVGRGCTTDTPLMEKAALEFGPRLHLLGERHDVASVLPDFDVLVLSSAYGEGFPNVLGEGLACAVPSVATDVGDAALILDDCGLIVPPRDPLALADAVTSILAKPETELAAWKLRMRQRAESLFSLPSVIARYESFYRKMALQPAATGLGLEKTNRNAG